MWVGCIVCVFRCRWRTCVGGGGVCVCGWWLSLCALWRLCVGGGGACVCGHQWCLCVSVSVVSVCVGFHGVCVCRCR